MKKIISLSLILKIFIVSAQEKEIKILNSENNKPISYANIKFLKSKKGTFSDDKGIFLINNNVTDSLLISVLGFEDKILSVSKIKDTIFLNTKIITLKEITLSNKKIEYGYFKKNGKFIRSALNRVIVAMYIPNENKKNEYITHLHYRIKKFGNELSTVRPHLLSVNKLTKNPNKEILNENIVIDINEKNKILSIDITDKNINFPKEGIFVALEWVGNTKNLGFGYSKLTDNNNSHYAVLTSLEFKKNIWVPLTPKKEDKTIAHFGITTKQSE
ncbi:MAG: hypothetical protein GKR88_07900 [Flavobacteriaceae bacterium]|nr:MAG: hypothetical protein GKR88_07900 [Flavobacteriaceae bacterium]